MIETITSTQANTTKKLAKKIKDIIEKDIGLDEKMLLISSDIKTFGIQGVSGLISEILSNKELLSQISSLAYFHKNGFCKIPIINDESFTLRLHVWNKGIVSNETLHDHRWHLASTIVLGKLTSEIWEETSSESAIACDEYVYTDKFTKPNFRGKVLVAHKETILRNTGDTYTMNPKQLHRIIKSDSSMVITLMCHSFPVRGKCRNIIVNEVVPCVYPKYIKEDEFSDFLNNVLREISESINMDKI